MGLGNLQFFDLRVYLISGQICATQLRLSISIHGLDARHSKFWQQQDWPQTYLLKTTLLCGLAAPHRSAISPDRWLNRGESALLAAKPIH